MSYSAQETQEVADMRPILRQPDVAHPQRLKEDKTNVGEEERWVSGVLGAGLAVHGIRRGGLGGWVEAMLGALLLYRGTTGHCPTYEMLGISTANEGGAMPEDFNLRGVHVQTSCLVAKPPAELYAYWRNLENLPSIMRHVRFVRVYTETLSHWVVRGPLGREVEWDAQIIHDVPDRLISWRSVEGADIENVGTVTFAPRGEGTEVIVVLDYIPPAGKIGRTLAEWLGGDPRSEIDSDLAEFKRKMEAQGVTRMVTEG